MVRLEVQLSKVPTAFMKISIPIWCDWKHPFLGCKWHLHTISIPIWCDWKRVFFLFRLTYLEFQFLYGAIGRPTTKTMTSDCRPFQFLYGAIGREGKKYMTI